MTRRTITSTPGFLAVSRTPGAGAAPDVAAALAALGAASARIAGGAALTTASWELEDLGTTEPLLLSRTARRRDRELAPGDVRRLLRSERRGLAEVHPAFAAVDRVGEDAVVASADGLGFRHLYHGAGRGFAVLSTSSRAVAACLGARLNRRAVAVQSLLGWQLGQRTLFHGVRKLAADEVATLRDGRVHLETIPRAAEGALTLGVGVAEAAAILRGSVEAFLDDHPGSVLQLTGGQDSRLLLSAIPPARRRDVRALTLVVPGNPDGAMAAALSRRYGMEHEVLRLDGIEELSPDDAEQRCRLAACRLEAMADPLAHAALGVAEARALPGPRLGGLGGEVARGFYYLGPTTSAPVTRARVERLARWRMLANESVPPDALEPQFAAWAHEVVVDDIYELMAATGRPWMAATDDFYLQQRMQRWAGIIGTAACFERVAVNPMLDDRFVAIARALAPRDKRGSRFLSLLQIALDDELARMPLDGRPAPVAYAHRSPANAARRAASTLRKGAGKVRQRAVGANRPPAGGDILAAKVTARWRAQPGLLNGARDAGIVREAWLEGVLAGAIEPPPSAVALLMNLTVAAESAVPAG